MIRRFREPVNGLTHLSAAVVAVIAVVFLMMAARGGGLKRASLLVYGISLVLMFGASAAYHSIKARPEVIVRLRKADHAAIYLLIAGTYTPICLHFFTGFWRWGLLGVIWSIALIGIGAKLLTVDTPRWLTAGTYLLMSWLSIAAIQEMLLTMPVGAMIWLLVGGIFFTVGSVIYITKRPDLFPGVFGFHEIWHIFVILGAFSHFVAVAAYIAR
ncbi:MAG: hemolysin III family protein [Anaerolineales bacterium]